jgi:prepilin-type N-terminal cleavage/methylation domain-containing protein
MNMHNTYIPCGTRHNSRGFSLVELMVALVITLILLAGIGQIFLSSKKSYAIQDTLGRMQENGRYAMDVLKADLRRAGYWGGNADISTIQGSLGINDTTTEACTTTGQSAWARMLNRGIYGLNLSGTEKPSTSSYACIRDSGASPYLRGDVLAVRYADPAEVGGITTPLASGQTIADAYPNQIFLRSSLFRGRIFEGTDSESASNDLDAPAVRTSLLVARAYYIGASSNTSRCPNDGPVPSLYRINVVNGGFVSEEVAYGVDNLQLEYGIDSDDSGSVDRYYDADALSTNPSTTPNWDQVIAARIWMLTRSECPETGYTNSNTYNMSENYTPADTANRGYRRKLYTSTVKLRNNS